MIISFAAHSNISSSNIIKELVKEQIRKTTVYSNLITCYLGGYGGFDEICAAACREVKREGLEIELVYVTPYISSSEQDKIKRFQKSGLYDTSIYPPIESTPPKFAILKRNEWMMANADVIIAYVRHSHGGAYKSLQIAKRKKKKIINISDLL